MKQKLIRVFIGLFLVAFLLSCHGAVATDQNMINHFKNNEDQFNRLIKMLSEDSQVQTLYRNANADKGKNTVGEKRLESYRAVMDILGIDVIYADRREGEIKLTRRDSYHFDWEKGYSYSIKSPVSLGESTDLYYNALRPYSVVYKRINDHWYLYLFRKTD